MTSWTNRDFLLIAALWRQIHWRSWSTLVLVMACYIMAPNHYMNQCWIIISEVLWYSPEGNFTGNAQDIYYLSFMWVWNWSIQGYRLISWDKWVNSLWPSNAMWRHRSGSTLAQVMACCLTAPSHYLNQCWLVINGFCGIHMRTFAQGNSHIILKDDFENYIFEITATSLRGQWVY